MKSLIARMRAGRVYVACDLRPPPSGGQGLMPSRPIGITSPIPLGIEEKWDNILERQIFRWL
jgi:hypothetical protein